MRSTQDQLGMHGPMRELVWQCFFQDFRGLQGLVRIVDSRWSSQDQVYEGAVRVDQ